MYEVPNIPFKSMRHILVYNKSIILVNNELTLHIEV